MKNVIDTAENPGLAPRKSEVQSADRAQLDLILNNGGYCPRPAYRRRQALRSRAAWWFQQMRRVVDSAVEWRPAPPPRPEQGTLDLRRPTEVTVQ